MSELSEDYASLTAAVSGRDLARIQELIDPSFVVHYDTSLPFGGEYHGAAGLFEVLGKLLGSVSDLKTEQLNYMEDDNGEQYTLIIEFTARLTGSDLPVSTQVAEVWTVRDGRAVEARIWYWGAAPLFAAA